MTPARALATATTTPARSARAGRCRRPLAAVLLALLAVVGAPGLWPSSARAAGADPVAIEELLRNARLWQQLGRSDNVRLVLEKILAVDGGQAQALLLLGELELREGRTAEAQRLLERLQRGGDAGAVTELQQLLRLYTTDLPRLQQLRLLRRGGNQTGAAALARELFPDGRAPGALAAEFAGLVGSGSRRAASPGRAPRVAAAPKVPAASPASSDPSGQRYWPLLREAEALRDAGQAQAASKRVAEALRLVPAEPEGLLLRAELETQLGRPAAAEALYRALLDGAADAALRERAARRLFALLQGAGRHDEALAEAARTQTAQALDTGALRVAADAELAVERPSAALRLLEAALALRPRDPWLRHDLARLYARLGQNGLARSVLAEGLAATPDDAEQVYAAALAYAAMDLDGEALAALDSVREAARTEGQRSLAQRLRDAQAAATARRSAEAAAALAVADRRRAESLAWRQPTDEVALFPYARRAADGRSSLRGLELPIVLTRPVGAETVEADSAEATPTSPRGHRWLHIDPVRIDAGALPADFAQASEFGTVLAGGQPLSAPLPQRARGLNLGVGYTGEQRRWDFGIVGAGFERPNLVGGWRQDLGGRGLDASVELSRRVLTGGLLPYAGTRDPISGRRWGGCHAERGNAACRPRAGGLEHFGQPARRLAGGAQRCQQRHAATAPGRRPRLDRRAGTAAEPGCHAGLVALPPQPWFPQLRPRRLLQPAALHQPVTALAGAGSAGGLELSLACLGGALVDLRGRRALLPHRCRPAGRHGPACAHRRAQRRHLDQPARRTRTPLRPALERGRVGVCRPFGLLRTDAVAVLPAPQPVATTR